jgi:hypothetical protein
MRTNRRFLACCFLFILGSGTCVAGADDPGSGRQALWRVPHLNPGRVIHFVTQHANARPGLKVATCQFPVSGDVAENAKYIKDWITKAAANKADIVHFSEAALSGYAGADVPDFDNYDWDKLRFHTQEIVSLAKEHSIWVVLGSAH